MSKISNKPCYGSTAKWKDLRHYIMYSSNLGLQSRARRIGVKYQLNSDLLYKIALANPNINEMWAKFEQTRAPKDAISFDRIDTSKGYVEGNVQAMSFQHNQYKRAFDNINKIDWVFGPEAYGISANYNKDGVLYRYATRDIVDNKILTFKDYDEAITARNKVYVYKLQVLLNNNVQLNIAALPAELASYIV